MSSMDSFSLGAPIVAPANADQILKYLEDQKMNNLEVLWVACFIIDSILASARENADKQPDGHLLMDILRMDIAQVVAAILKNGMEPVH